MSGKKHDLMVADAVPNPVNSGSPPCSGTRQQWSKPQIRIESVKATYGIPDSPGGDAHGQKSIQQS